MTEAEATTLLTDCQRVIFYRDTRAGAKFNLGKASAAGCEVSAPQELQTYWEYPEFVRGGVPAR